ncbi:MAG: GNAT family N-acetyltransferase [Eubacteriales bacterium]|nr:GNAT family N-acetyltransferase [Eubacteriales bacterium]
MIRLAAPADLDAIEESYREHFTYEKNHIAYTVFQEGVYPTRGVAEQALHRNALYVYEENGIVLGSLILDGRQPAEYKKINWPSQAAVEQTMVIHLLLVRPCAKGKGIGSQLVTYAVETARQRACTAVRLDTGAQNTPAVSLYQRHGFQLAAATAMNVGGAIPHKDHLFFEKIV